MDNRKLLVALSIDVEEFDLPAEHGVRLRPERQIEVSTQGLQRVLDLFHGMGVRATFFCTVAYATAKPDLIRSIVARGHEVASHSVNHSAFAEGDLLSSRLKLEEITGVQVRGFRAPRMASTSPDELINAGYTWDSSLNPCFIPGRYNNATAPRMPFRHPSGLVELPASVANIARFPLFWLAAHNLPIGMYRSLCVKSLVKTGFLNIYFHPWEFSDYLHERELRVPFIIRRNSGQTLVRRLATLVAALKETPGAHFVTLSELSSLA